MVCGGLTMKILAMECETEHADWSGAQPLLADEARHVYDLYLKNVVREIYFTEAHEAVLILECGSVDEAQQLLDALPLVKSGLIRFELTRLLPYDGYSRLMGA